MAMGSPFRRNGTWRRWRRGARLGAGGGVVVEDAVEAGRARSTAPGRRRKRASWCSARIRPDLEEQLQGIGVGAQMALLRSRGRSRARKRRLPGLHHAGERVAHWARAVVELHCAADVDAARIELDRHPPHPALEEASAAGRDLFHRGKNTPPRSGGGTADDRDLQFLARAEVGEHAGLAHLHDFGEGADRQPSRPMCDARASAASRIAARVCWPFCSGLAAAVSDKVKPALRVEGRPEG